MNDDLDDVIPAVDDTGLVRQEQEITEAEVLEAIEGDDDAGDETRKPG